MQPSHSLFVEWEFSTFLFSQKKKKTTEKGEEEKKKRHQLHTTAILFLCNIKATIGLDFGNGKAHVDVLAGLHQVFEHGVVASTHVA